MNRSPRLAVSYLLIILLPVRSHRSSNPQCYLQGFEPYQEYEYYKEGDVIIAGLISAHWHLGRVTFFNRTDILDLFCETVQAESYRSILSFIFAVDEINNDPDLLPNITLGYHILDTCGNALKTAQSVYRIFSGRHKNVPNYSCRDHGEVAAFVVDSNYYTSHTALLLLSQYKYTQLNYGVNDPILLDRDLYPTSYLFAPDDGTRNKAIVHLMVNCRWNWVGIITTGQESNEMGVRELSRRMAKHQICIAYIINLRHKEKAISQLSDKPTAEVIVFYGSYAPEYVTLIRNAKAHFENITLILHETWNKILYGIHPNLVRFMNCSLFFVVAPRRILKVEESIKNVNPSIRPNDPLLEEIWFRIFNCLTKDQQRNEWYQWFYKRTGRNCTETYYIPPSSYKAKDKNLYFTYVSVYILAHALHAMKVTSNKLSTYQSQQKLQKYMKYVKFTDPSGNDIFFDDRDEVIFQWNLVNWLMYGSEYIYFRENIISVFKEWSKDKFMMQHVADITWKNDRFPESRCNEPCYPGSRKASNGGRYICCHDCVPCSEGEVSNITESEVCHECPEDEWPDEKKVICLPKTYVFLSYEDIFVHIFSVLALLFSAVTLFILGIFIYYWDTPIVKANNRTVSFILLVSILLSFLSVFFFLGRPVDITCLLRQTSFGVFFTIGVSSVLAKTITVCIAFKATKPGSSWRKWVSIKVSNSVVLVCSSVQVFICVIWLLVSPPYVEFDHHSYPGKIIIQCNEGSDIWFYSMLGYMGFLAFVSFVLAFMVRTLPDSFNEAKYITFSMLLFCSVWIAMIPVYMSTRGKYMVAVEIFAILTSCAGILGCIFVPKVFIILLKPDLNSRNIIMEKKL